MFKVLGALLVLHVFHALNAGKVYVNSGFSGKFVAREESPACFWMVIVIYSGLSLAPFFLF